MRHQTVRIVANQVVDPNRLATYRRDKTARQYQSTAPCEHGHYQRLIYNDTCAVCMDNYFDKTPRDGVYIRKHGEVGFKRFHRADGHLIEKYLSKVKPLFDMALVDHHETFIFLTMGGEPC